jgi:hypothetical protein
MGGDFFTRSLARIRNCTEDEAELAKQSANLLEGPDALPEFVGTIEGWVAELKRQLNDWFERNPALVTEVSTFRMIASGGATEQPGLIEYLDREAGLKLQPWPADQDPEAAQPSPGYEIAFGAVLQAFGASTQPVTLLPADYRQAWNRRLTRQRIEFASAALILICALLLAGGTWHKASLAHRKDAWLGKIRTAQEAVEANALLRAELLGNYEELRPMFVGQQNTLDTLKTLNLLELSRSNQSLWYVLVADQQTYFSQPPALTSTNKPARTNLLSSPGDRPVPIAGSATSSGPQPTEATPAKPGLIAELCVPESPEAARAVLSQVVNSLKQQQLFSKADLLSDDLRRSFADPKVVVPDRQYVLQLDFSETEFQQPFAPARLSSAATPRTPGKRGSPPPRPAQRPNGTTKQRPR